MERAHTRCGTYHSWPLIGQLEQWPLTLDPQFAWSALTHGSTHGIPLLDQVALIDRFLNAH